MNQMTFSDMEYSGRKRVTQKEKFLREMNDIIPWADWVNKILPYYPTGKRGRPPRGIEVMLRMYLLQIWFNLSDEGLEDAIYDSYAMRNFVGINFLEEQVPDATTLLKFRHLLEEHHLGEEIFNDIKERLQKAGLMMRGGTIVDATIIHSTPSTKNKEGKRDPEMHQTKKGNQWYHRIHKVQSRARVPDREAAIRIQQDSVSWNCQEHESVPHAVRMCEPAHVHTWWQS